MGLSTMRSTLIPLIDLIKYASSGTNQPHQHVVKLTIDTIF